jgi:hypothetical protein
MTEQETRDEYPVLREDLPELRRDRPAARPVPARHDRWHTVANQAQARGVAVGDDGSVWLATSGGILRWRPGLKEFTRYGSEHGLPGNAISAIAVDGQGRTWALGDQGRLSYRNGEAWTSYDPLATSTICCLATDENGRLWAASAGGAWAVDDPAAPPEALAPGPASAWQIVAPRALAVGGPGDVWLCSAAGVSRHDGTGWQDPLPPRDTLTLARQGASLWLGTAAGLRRLDLATHQEAPRASWPKAPVTALAAGADGVWAACDGEIGFATADGWQPVPDLRFRSPVTGLAAAGPGQVWIAGHDGLWRAGPEGYRMISTEAPPELIEDLRADKPFETFDNLVQALAFAEVDGRPALWIGTPRGLAYVDLPSDHWRAYSHAALLQDVRALATGLSDEMWVASWSGELRRLQGRRLAFVQSAAPGIVLGLTSGAAGPWAAVGLDPKTTTNPELPLDGIYRWDGAQWALALPARTLPTRALPPGARQELASQEATIVQGVVEDAAGRLWLGTSSGLFGWMPGDPAPVAPDASLGDRDVRALLALDTGELCVGAAAGLFAGAPGHLAAVANWPGSRVTALAWDPADEAVWCGTDAGLVRLARQPAGWQIEATYTAETHGLAANIVTALALGVDQVGNRCLWIGTPSGVSCFRME